MNERTEGNNRVPTLNPGSETSTSAKPPDPSWPSRDARLALIRDYQSRALDNHDPHLANIELFDGDTMLLALRLRELMDKELIDGPTREASRQFAQRTEMFLKCVRQIDRNARIKRQLTRLAKDESGLG